MSLKARVQRSLIKRWKAIAVATAFCAALGVGVGLALGEDVYVAEGTLRYIALPLPTNQDLKDLYKPEKFDTLTKQVLHPTYREKPAARNSLKIPPKILARFLKADTPQGAESITVTMEWANRQQAADMVNGLMDIYVDDVVATRKESIENQWADSKKKLKQSE